MKYISKKYIVAVAIVWFVTILAGLVMYVTILEPASRQIVEAQIKLKDATTSLREIQQLRSEQAKEKLNSDLEDIKSTLANFMTESKKATKLTFEISQIASNIKVKDFSSKINESESLEVVPDCEIIGERWIDVSFTADFPQFAGFVNSLERNNPFLFVESFDIKPSTTDKQSNEVKMNLAFFVGTEVAKNIP